MNFKAFELFWEEEYLFHSWRSKEDRVPIRERSPLFEPPGHYRKIIPGRHGWNTKPWKDRFPASYQVIDLSQGFEGTFEGGVLLEEDYRLTSTQFQVLRGGYMENSRPTQSTIGPGCQRGLYRDSRPVWYTWSDFLDGQKAKVTREVWAWRSTSEGEP